MTTIRIGVLLFIGAILILDGECRVMNKRVKDIDALITRIRTSKFGFFAVFDKNDDEKITYQEMLEVGTVDMSQEQDRKNPEEIQAAFNILDGNHDGIVTPDETSIHNYGPGRRTSKRSPQVKEGTINTGINVDEETANTRTNDEVDTATNDVEETANTATNDEIETTKTSTNDDDEGETPKTPTSDEDDMININVDDADNFFDMIEHFLASDLGLLAFSDINKDHKISYEELHNFIMTIASSDDPNPTNSAEIQENFQRMDINNDGFITGDEVPKDSNESDDFAASLT